MEIRQAKLEDIDEVLKLHYKYQIDSIKEEDKKDGFITTAFTKEEMTKLITEENGLFIVKIDGKIVAYCMCASWQYWLKWPMFQFMVEHLHELNYLGQTLTVDNSYQYGPVCVDKSVRGTSVLKELFEFARVEMNKRYPILVTFINKINPRSYIAHTKKLGLEVICEFEFNNNTYYELVYDTSKQS